MRIEVRCEHFNLQIRNVDHFFLSVIRESCFERHVVNEQFQSNTTPQPSPLLRTRIMLDIYASFSFEYYPARSLCKLCVSVRLVVQIWNFLLLCPYSPSIKDFR